jgi:hypothetical protein
MTLSHISVCLLALTAVCCAESWRIQTTVGRPVHRGILGQTWAAHLRSPAPQSATSMRGVAAGLAADSYDWMKRTGNDAMNVGTTLDYLRDCRDHGWIPLITANLRGTFDKNGPSNRYSDMDPEKIARLAADWVIYCNRIVPVLREGDPVADPEFRRILDSITWSPKLFPKGGKPSPTVTYWELGNEPAVGAGTGLDGRIFNYQEKPDLYVKVYQKVSSAMLAADPRIRIGPSFSCGEAIDPLSGRPHVAELLRSGLPIHFLSYHGYAHMHHHWPDADEMSKVLRTEAWHGFVESKHLKIADKLRETGHDPEKMPFMVSEYNTASWGDNNAQVSMARALGTAANIFAFMECGYVMANNWDAVTYTGVKWPVLLALEKFHQDLGDVFLGSHVSDGLLVCATRNTNGSDLVLWAVNLNAEGSRELDVEITDAPGLTSVTSMRLGNPGGTSLTDRNTALTPQQVSWSAPQPVPLADGRVRLQVAASEFVVFKFAGNLPTAHVVDGLVSQSVSIKNSGIEKPASASKPKPTTRDPARIEPVLHLPLTRQEGLKLVGPGARIDPSLGLILEQGSYAMVDPGPIIPLGPGCEATFAIWFKSDRPGTLFCKSENHAGPSSHEYALILEKWGIRPMSAVNIRMFKSLTGSGNGSFIDNEWHHVALVCRDQLAVVYINGVERGRFDTLQANIPMNQPLLIGARSTIRPSAIHASFDGALRDLRIYQRALLPSEIKRIIGAATAQP